MGAWALVLAFILYLIVAIDLAQRKNYASQGKWQKTTKIEKPDRYTILTFPTHERYETQLCKTGHDFYAFTSTDQKKWDTAYAELPDNYYLLPENSIFG